MKSVIMITFGKFLMIFCRSLVLPPQAKIVDRSDPAALHTSLLKTWKAFLTRCCSRVMFDPPFLPFVNCAHNHCRTLPLHQQHSTIVKHSRPHHSLRLKRLFGIFGSTDQPKVFQCPASVRVLHSCVVNMSSGARHSWEAGDVHLQSSGGRALDEHDETWSADDVDDNDPKLAVDLATQACLHNLLDLADETKMSAKDVRVLCWYASKAGMSDDVKTHHRGTNLRHLDSVLDFAERQSQFLQVASGGHSKARRFTEHLRHVRVARKRGVQRGSKGDAGLSGWLCLAKTTNGLPKNYHEHPVVKRKFNEDVCPVAIHMDAVPYSLNDSAVGIWLVNMLSVQRHSMCIVRKLRDDTLYDKCFLEPNIYEFFER